MGNQQLKSYVTECYMLSEDRFYSAAAKVQIILAFLKIDLFLCF